MLSKYPFIFKIVSKTNKVVQLKLQEIFSQYGPPKWFSYTMVPKFLLRIHTIHDNTRHPPPNIIPFVSQVKWYQWKISLNYKSSTYYIQSIGHICGIPPFKHLINTCPALEKSCQIGHRNTQDSHQKTVDFWEVHNYFIIKNTSQTEYHNKRHKAVQFPKLHPGQYISLSPDQSSTYIPSTIISPAPQPRS